MHKPESVLENKTQKILWDSETQADLLILARGPGLVIVKKKKTCRIVDSAVSADHKVKIKENEKRDKYVDLAREVKTKNYGTWRWQWYQL